MTEFEKIVAQVDSNILEAQNRTECERIERYELFGFTEGDYRETKEITGDFFMLWHAPKFAREKGTTPQEIVSQTDDWPPVARIQFPRHVLRERS